MQDALIELTFFPRLSRPAELFFPWQYRRCEVLPRCSDDASCQRSFAISFRLSTCRRKIISQLWELFMFNAVFMFNAENYELSSRNLYEMNFIPMRISEPKNDLDWNWPDNCLNSSLSPIVHWPRLRIRRKHKTLWLTSDDSMEVLTEALAGASRKGQRRRHRTSCRFAST